MLKNENTILKISSNKFANARVLDYTRDRG